MTAAEPPDPHRHRASSWGAGSLAAIAAAFAGACGALVARDPHISGSFGLCPSAAVGIYCPGCGGLRATHDLLTGHVAESVSHNVLVIPLFVWALWWWSAQAASKFGLRIRPAPSSLPFLVIAASCVVLFSIGRNLPGSPLAP